MILRPFSLTDAPAVQRLAGDRDVASTTLNIPHPYEDGMAEEWINGQQQSFEQNEFVTFAVALRPDNTLIGAISLHLDPGHDRAELGYWIGKPYWNQGYGTEAGRAVVQYGFEVIGLNRIHAAYLKRNPASGRIMQKIGMMYEGCLQQHLKRWETFEDVELYGILKRDYESQRDDGH